MLFLKKTIFVFLCLIIQVTSFSDIAFGSDDYSQKNERIIKSDVASVIKSTGGDFSIQSTDVWAEYSFVEYGKNIQIHYSFFELIQC
ncbi:hypothetical protein HMSSN139_67960 [Paenibacillus sp. HMSSN-139]|nr:hypothetical protein HMSSN139_67960 [Paenibacillus sp. HMSSN-139]